MRKKLPKECKYFQGSFKPRNPSKYLGDHRDIFFRSGLEFTYMMHLDGDPNVIEWESETFAIPYSDPTTRPPKLRRYFPDFRVTKRDENGKTKTYVIEIKPEEQTKKPKHKGKKDRKSQRRFLKEALVFGKNMAKWEAAERYCAIKGFEFVILTEKQLRAL